MKPLATAFKSHGFHFEQVERQANIAIYRKSKPGYSGYEVVRIQHIKPVLFHGKLIPEHERMPSDEQWGTHGFTCQTLDAAKARFHQLLQTQDRPALGSTASQEPLSHPEPLTGHPNPTSACHA